MLKALASYYQRTSFKQYLELLLEKSQQKIHTDIFRELIAYVCKPLLFFCCTPDCRQKLLIIREGQL